MKLDDLQPGYELDALVAEAIGFPHMKAGHAYGRYLDAGQAGVISPGGKPQRFTGIGQIPVDFQPSKSVDDAVFALAGCGMLDEHNDCMLVHVRGDLWEVMLYGNSLVGGPAPLAHAISLAVCEFKGVGE